jgi:hypothetical protein
MREYEDAKPRLTWHFVICMVIASGVLWLELFVRLGRKG